MRLVLVRLSALGDVVHTWPLAVAVRAARPDLHLTWVVEEPLRPLVEGHPAVDAVIGISSRRWRRHPFAATTRSEVAVLRSRLQELAPDLVVDVQGTLKSALVVRASRAPRRVGLARPWRREAVAGMAYTETVAGCRDRRHVVATNLELVRALGLEPPPETPAPDGRWLVARQPPEETAAVGRRAVLLPGAGAADKVLSVATLAEVAQRLAAHGLGVTVAWGPGEQERAAAVAAAAGDVATVAPPTDIPALARLLAGAALVVGADTGPVHLAASLGTPTVAVFLATDWRRNGPLGERVRVVAAAEPSNRGPTGSARARQVRMPAGAEIAEAAAALLVTRS